MKNIQSFLIKNVATLSLFFTLLGAIFGAAIFIENSNQTTRSELKTDINIVSANLLALDHRLSDKIVNSSEKLEKSIKDLQINLETKIGLSEARLDKRITRLENIILNKRVENTDTDGKLNPPTRPSINSTITSPDNNKLALDHENHRLF